MESAVHDVPAIHGECRDALVGAGHARESSLVIADMARPYQVMAVFIGLIHRELLTMFMASPYKPLPEYIMLKHKNPSKFKGNGSDVPKRHPVANPGCIYNQGKTTI